MSISSAFSNALSGLTASARAAGVVSANLANVQTEGYGRREISLAPEGRGVTGGVRVTGITRHVNAGILSDRRLADGALAHTETRSHFLTRLQSDIGTPDQAGSLSARVGALEAALVSATSRPEANDRLQSVAQRAAEVAAQFNSVSNGIQAQRMAAEEDIAATVRRLNYDLAQVHDINVQIQAARRGGSDGLGLLDHRQAVIDRISKEIPVREIPRDDGAVALMTPGGALLVDGRAATLDFTRANMIAPHMTGENGLLSGLSINGRDVAASGDRSSIANGRLTALFEVRDTLAMDAQTQLDALARDLIERFQDAGVDATRVPGDPGLFTDAGAAFDPADEVGIAGRIRLVDSVAADGAGEVWRLRDGLGATAPGPMGNSVVLGALGDALSGRAAMAAAGLGGGAGTTVQHIGSFVSYLAQDALAEERATGFAVVRQSGLQEQILNDGVNSDQETQRLLLIEQSYAANARMIQTLDDMMQTLLRI